MIQKPLKRKDSIEKLHNEKIRNLEKQSNYFGMLLTASLPRYIENKNNEEQSNQYVAEAKKLYFADSPLKNTPKSLTKNNNQIRSPLKLKNNEAQSPLKLRKTSPKKSEPETPSGILKTPRLKSTQIQNTPTNKKKYDPKNPENQKKLHPYSILIKLEKDQADLPQSQKITYQYRKIHDLRSYTEQQIDQMIDELLVKCTFLQNNQRLSITDQFILSRFFDLKVRKVIEKKKQSRQQKNQKNVHTYQMPSKKKQKQPNEQLLKAFGEIKFVWDFYQLKLKHCPDLVKGNLKDELIYSQIKMLYLELKELQDQIKQSKEEDEEEDSSKVKDLREDKRKKIKCHPKKMTEEVVAKKIKIVMKKFKDIMVSN